MAERTCIVCKHKYNQKDLIRLVFDHGHIQIQSNKKLDGRGTYICKNKECMANLLKTKALNRAFKCNINSEEYEKVLNNLKN